MVMLCVCVCARGRGAHREAKEEFPNCLGKMKEQYRVVHLLLGIIRSLRGYDNNKDETDSYTRSIYGQQFRGEEVEVAAAAEAKAREAISLSCVIFLFWLASHSSFLLARTHIWMESFSFTTAGRLEETLDYLAKMLLKKLYVNQLQANRISPSKQASRFILKNWNF